VIPNLAPPAPQQHQTIQTVTHRAQTVSQRCLARPTDRDHGIERIGISRAKLGRQTLLGQVRQRAHAPVSCPTHTGQRGQVARVREREHAAEGLLGYGVQHV